MSKSPWAGGYRQPKDDGERAVQSVTYIVREVIGMIADESEDLPTDWAYTLGLDVASRIAAVMISGVAWCEEADRDRVLDVFVSAVRRRLEEIT